MSLQRRIVNFSGPVQGVGFRYTACRAAGGYKVTGYVRNLPDGTVEIVVEGDHDEIDQFLADVLREMKGYIRRTTQQTAAHQNEFRSFGVRY